jgi:hypothetical protein
VVIIAPKLFCRNDGQEQVTPWWSSWQVLLKASGAEIHFGLFERHGEELLHCLYCVPIRHFIEGERHSFLLA